MGLLITSQSVEHERQDIGLARIVAARQLIAIREPDPDGF